jgi:hypothetical protein
VFGFPDTYWADYPKKIAAVTKDDVRRVARKYLDPAHLAIVVVGDRQSIEGPLAKIAPVEARDLDGDPLSAGEPGPGKKTASSESHPSHDDRRGR